jgi:dihydrofolate reductase
MRKIVVLEGMSLDGVFDAQTMGRWAQPFYSDDRDAVIRDIVLASDGLLLGRRTYDIQAYWWPSQKGDKYGIADWKNQIPKYVVTSTPLTAQWNNATTINDNVVDEIAGLKQQPGKDILIEGSATLVQSLVQAGLIDTYRIIVHPVIVGCGKHFFQEGMGLSKLNLVDSKTISKGVVLLSYEVAR